MGDVKYTRADMRRLEAFTMRLWELLRPDEQVKHCGSRETNSPLLDVPVHARVKVAFELIEEIADEFAMDGDLASQEEYDHDASRVRAIAGMEQSSEDSIALLRKSVERAFDRFEDARREKNP